MNPPPRVTESASWAIRLRSAGGWRSVGANIRVTKGTRVLAYLAGEGPESLDDPSGGSIGNRANSRDRHRSRGGQLQATRGLSGRGRSLSAGERTSEHRL